MPDDSVSRASPTGRARSRRRAPPTTPNPWASSTYRSASYSRARRANSPRSGALPSIELTPSSAWHRGVVELDRSSSSRCSGSSCRKRCALAPWPDEADDRPVVDRLVRPPVEEDRARARQDRDDRHVDVRDRWGRAACPARRRAPSPCPRSPRTGPGFPGDGTTTGCVPHRSRYAGTAAIVSRCRSKPR